MQASWEMELNSKSGLWLLRLNWTHAHGLSDFYSEAIKWHAPKFHSCYIEWYVKDSRSPFLSQCLAYCIVVYAVYQTKMPTHTRRPLPDAEKYAIANQRGILDCNATTVHCRSERETKWRRERERWRASINCTCCSCCYYCCCWVLCCFACILFYIPHHCSLTLSFPLSLSRFRIVRDDVAKLMRRGFLCSFLACLPLVALGLSSSLVRPSLCHRCKRMEGGGRWKIMVGGGLIPPTHFHCCILFSYILLLLLYFALFCAVFCFAAALGPWLRVMYRYDRRLVARSLHAIL